MPKSVKKAPSQAALDPKRVRAWFEVDDGSYWMRHTLVRYPNIKRVVVISEHEDDGVFFVKIPGKGALVPTCDLKEYAFIIAADDVEPGFPEAKLNLIREQKRKSSRRTKALFKRMNDERIAEIGHAEFQRQTKEALGQYATWMEAIRLRLTAKLKEGMQ